MEKSKKICLVSLELENYIKKKWLVHCFELISTEAESFIWNTA